MKKYILLSLLCSSYLVGTVSRMEVKYALDYPDASYLTVRKRHLQFFDSSGYIQLVKLSILKKKHRRLYNKFKEITEERSPYYSKRKKKGKKKAKHILASIHQLYALPRAQSNIEDNDHNRTRVSRYQSSCYKKREKKQQGASFSTTLPSIDYIDQDQPVNPTILVEESKLEENWGKEESRFRVYSNNRLSMDWDSQPLV